MTTDAPTRTYSLLERLAGTLKRQHADDKEWGITEDIALEILLQLAREKPMLDSERDLRHFKIEIRRNPESGHLASIAVDKNSIRNLPGRR